MVAGGSAGHVKAPTEGDGKFTINTLAAKGVGIEMAGEGTVAKLPNGSLIAQTSSPSTYVTAERIDVAAAGTKATSVRQTITIGDASGDERYDFPITVPKGGALIKESDGSVSVLNGAKQQVATLAPPWAHDAKGKQVKTWYEFKGHTLTQVVKHAGAAYPVTADPWFVVLIPVVARVGVVLLRQAVTASSKKAAAKSATKTAVKQGYKPVYAPAKLQVYKGSFYTAKGFSIRLGAAFSKKNGYSSFAAFKKANGNARSGYEWHHIVEQGMVKSTGGRIKTWMVQNKQNLIQIPKDIHRKCITPIMGTKMKNLPAHQLARLIPGTIPASTKNLTPRAYMAKYMSERNQHLYGMELLKICGVVV
ncbi:hypothetical protein [Galactobacter valiniphilus]|uniref:hypothetical protein n=1 Tax=Galactobacter valiniphilus TaxID=2676122 RepID=UPI0037352FA1